MHIECIDFNAHGLSRDVARQDKSVGAPSPYEHLGGTRCPGDFDNLRGRTSPIMTPQDLTIARRGKSLQKR